MGTKEDPRYVSLETCVAKSLVRTEQRTVSALLGARSAVQVHHVVKAALQRNEYVELAKKGLMTLTRRRWRREEKGACRHPRALRGVHHIHQGLLLKLLLSLYITQPTSSSYIKQRLLPTHRLMRQPPSSPLANMITAQQAAIAMPSQQIGKHA